MTPVLRLYNPDTKKILEPLKDSYLLKKTYCHGFKAQKILQHLKDDHLWLLCECKKPGAIMYANQINSVFYLKNHSKHGVHDERCHFFSTVKGEDPEPSSENSNVSKKITEFRIFNDYACEQNIPLETKSLNSKSKPTQNKLISLLRNLYEKSFSNIVYTPFVRNPYQMLMEMRNEGAQNLSMGTLGSVKEHLYVGKHGLMFLEKNMSSWRDKNPLERHQCFLLMHANEIIIVKEGDSYKVKVNGDTGSLDIVCKNRPQIPKPFTDKTCFPSIFIMAFAFTDQNSKKPICLKSAIQPVHPETLLPIDSGYESKFITLVKYKIKEISNQIYIRKPLLPRIIDGISITPDLVLGKRGSGFRIVFEVMGLDTKDYIDRKARTVPLMTTSYGPVFEFNAFEFAQNEEVFNAEAILSIDRGLAILNKT
jgi:hypothetical protein